MTRHNRHSPIFQVDSYKTSHEVAYPSGTTELFSYFASRGGKYPSTVFFGLQALILQHLLTPVTQADLDYATQFFPAHGVPFNRAAWQRVIDVHGGFMPIEIFAAPEGSRLPSHCTPFCVRSTDEELPWIASYVETMLVRLWYPSTVATVSWNIKGQIRRYLNETSDDPEGQLPFKLHDFGARGTSSHESAAIGGMAHLVNFSGSDNVEGILAAIEFYDAEMPAYSIPASEHSTITAWGREGEADAYRNMIRQFGKKGAIFACVSDSYDLLNALEIWASLKPEIVKSGATLVVRPDSGKPVDVVMQTLASLKDNFGSTVNAKGYHVLENVRVIQGDGVNEDSITEILSAMEHNKYSIDNIAFGMGGALLQKVDRDMQSFAYKASNVIVQGQSRPICKDPVTDPGKRSQQGYLDLVCEDGVYRTIAGKPGTSHNTVMEKVYEPGKLLRRWSFAEVRARSGRPST